MSTTTTHPTLTSIRAARYVVHFLDLLPPGSWGDYKTGALYARAVAAARPHGGRKYHCRAYGGGVAYTGTPEQVRVKVDATRASLASLASLASPTA